MTILIRVCVCDLIGAVCGTKIIQAAIGSKPDSNQLAPSRQWRRQGGARGGICPPNVFQIVVFVVIMKKNESGKAQLSSGVGSRDGVQGGPKYLSPPH